MRALESLKALGLVGHRKGQTRYTQNAFSPDHFITLPGRAARFWATVKLIKLARDHGIHDGNVLDHFVSEPPRHPLVLKDYASGRGRDKDRGPVIKSYERTPLTERLEADVRELNEFLASFRITGGTHEGYVRVFNLRAWTKGGRLYSLGQDTYQQKSEDQRHQMTINDEPIAEIDIKASFLSIYHAKLRMPLEGSSDPYARAGVARDIAKLWMLVSFGNTKPATRWPPEMVKQYAKESGKDLRKTKAKDVGQKMLTAFPALQKLERHSQIWADLQFIESNAIMGTMLILKRSHGVPSLSMHDGLIVPRSKAEIAKQVLSEQYRHFVGVTPRLTVEPEGAVVRPEDL